MSVTLRSKFGRLATSAAVLALAFQAPAHAASLTLLHNNDLESRLLERTVDGQPYAGLARFVTVLEEQRQQAQGAGRDVLTISSGDNFLPSTVFSASLSSGTFFDAQAINAIDYDAVVIGNHEFDFGPDVLANFIQQTESDIPFLSANLDFSGESSLQALVDAGRIVQSTVVERGAERYGIIGATTEELPFISAPGGVEVNPVVAAVQGEINALQAAGVNKIIFASHLQQLNTDVETIAQLAGIDIVIAGGSDALLRNPASDQSPDPFGQTPIGPYPLTQFNGENGYSGPAVTDANGNVVPIVSTAGEYRYLGRADIEFDEQGNLTSIDGQPILVGPNVQPDQSIVQQIIQPVEQAIATLANNIVGTTEVPLNALNADLRTSETNLGDLVADAYRFQARQADENNPDLLGDNPLVALTNAGGIRTNSLVPEGQLSEADVINILPFANFLSVFNDVTPQQLKDLLEYGVAAIPEINGRFPQISGLSFVYDPNQPAGSRIIQIALEGGQILFQNGTFADLMLDLVTLDFLARGGDGYPFAALGLTDFVNTGFTYQQAFLNFLTSPEGLNGLISAEDYPLGGLGRITQGTAQVPEPAALALLGLGFAGLIAVRRRRAA